MIKISFYINKIDVLQIRKIDSNHPEYIVHKGFIDNANIMGFQTSGLSSTKKYLSGSIMKVLSHLLILGNDIFGLRHFPRAWWFQYHSSSLVVQILINLIMGLMT